MNTYLTNKTECTNLFEGNTVFIFNDPLTKIDLEGKATLIEPFIKNVELEFWMVSFLSNPEAICFRWVAKNE